MAVLTKADRAAVIGFALAKAFSPRFIAVREECEGLLRAHLAAEHPRFLALLADPEAAQYIARTGSAGFTLVNSEGHTRCFHMPRFWRAPYLRAETRRSWVERDMYTALVAQETVVPASMGQKFEITDDVLVSRYLNVWSDLAHADEKMTALLAAYRTREKLAEDFPDIAAWLPPIEPPAALPAVIPATERAALQALGVL